MEYPVPFIPLWASFSLSTKYRSMRDRPVMINLDLKTDHDPPTPPVDQYAGRGFELDFSMFDEAIRKGL